MRIVVLDGHTLNPGDISWKEIEQLGELTVYPRTNGDEVVKRAANAEIILTNKTVITSEHIRQLPLLKYIGVLATGYNVVDIEAASAQGIYVCNIPAYSTPSVAQMVFAHILTITNRVEHYTIENKERHRWTSNTDFCYWDTPLIELSGKRIGIIGMGNIGQAVARIATAFGMNVCAFTSKPQEQLGTEVEKVELDKLFRTSDIISLHCPLTVQTEEIINIGTLRQMKQNCILINTGRGPLVNEKELAQALNEGIIAAYGTDVLTTEPAKGDNPLLTAKNVFITPHIAWASKEARQRLMTICAENIKAYQNNQPQNVVNKC